MDDYRSEAGMTKNKRGILFKLMKRKFEDHVYDYLNNGDFSSMEDLDAWLEKEFCTFYDEIDTIKVFYGNPDNSENEM